MDEYPKIKTMFVRGDDGKVKCNIHRDLLDHLLATCEYSDPVFEYLAGLPWLTHEKIDGTNIRVKFIGGKVEIAGRTEKAQVPAQLKSCITKIFDERLEDMKKVFCDDDGTVFDACIYGEGYGPGIQKGGELYSDKNGFAVFDVKVADWWLLPDAVLDVCKKLKLERAPYLGEATLTEIANTIGSGMRSRLAEKHGKERDAEGIVARPPVQLFDRMGNRVMVKLKTKDFPVC